MARRRLLFPQHKKATKKGTCDHRFMFCFEMHEENSVKLRAKSHLNKSVGVSYWVRPELRWVPVFVEFEGELGGVERKGPALVSLCSPRLRKGVHEQNVLADVAARELCRAPGRRRNEVKHQVTEYIQCGQTSETMRATSGLRQSRWQCMPMGACIKGSSCLLGSQSSGAVDDALSGRMAPSIMFCAVA